MGRARAFMGAAVVGLATLLGCAQPRVARAPEPARDTELPQGAFGGAGAPAPVEVAETPTLVRPRLSYTLVLGQPSDAAWTQAGDAHGRGQPMVAPDGPAPPRDLFAEDAATRAYTSSRGRYGRTYARGGAAPRVAHGPAIGGNWPAIRAVSGGPHAAPHAFGGRPSFGGHASSGAGHAFGGRVSGGHARGGGRAGGGHR